MCGGVSEKSFFDYACFFVQERGCAFPLGLVGFPDFGGEVGFLLGSHPFIIGLRLFLLFFGFPFRFLDRFFDDSLFRGSSCRFVRVFLFVITVGFSDGFS